MVVLKTRARAALALSALFVLSVAHGSSAQSAQADYGAVVMKYCVSCHNDRLKTAGLALDKANVADPSATADVWEKAIRKMRVGMMPPQNAPHPDAQTQTELIAYLTTALDKAASLRPNPGRPLVHRLNRAEYANAIRDLLALDVDPSSLLPPGDAAYG